MDWSINTDMSVIFKLSVDIMQLEFLKTEICGNSIIYMKICNTKNNQSTLITEKKKYHVILTIQLLMEQGIPPQWFTSKIFRKILRNTFICADFCDSIVHWINNIFLKRQ